MGNGHRGGSPHHSHDGDNHPGQGNPHGPGNGGGRGF